LPPLQETSLSRKQTEKAFIPPTDELEKKKTQVRKIQPKVVAQSSKLQLNTKQREGDHDYERQLKKEKTLLQKKEKWLDPGMVNKKMTKEVFERTCCRKEHDQGNVQTGQRAKHIVTHARG